MDLTGTLSAVTHLALPRYPEQREQRSANGLHQCLPCHASILESGLVLTKQYIAVSDLAYHSTRDHGGTCARESTRHISNYSHNVE